MQDTILVGKIVKAQGIKGEVKVKPITKSISRFKKLNYVLIDNNKYSISGARIGVDGFVYLMFVEVSTRNDAEMLKDKELYIHKEDRVTLEKDEYFIDDLMHSSLFDENNNELGEIINIENYGSADIITVACGFGDSFSFPLLKDLIISFDENEKKVVIDKNKLEEIKVWE